MRRRKEPIKISAMMPSYIHNASVDRVSHSAELSLLKPKSVASSPVLSSPLDTGSRLCFERPPLEPFDLRNSSAIALLTMSCAGADSGGA